MISCLKETNTFEKVQRMIEEYVVIKSVSYFCVTLPNKELNTCKVNSVAPHKPYFLDRLRPASQRWSQ